MLGSEGLCQSSYSINLLCHISYYVISIIDTFARRRLENKITCVGEEAFVKHIVFLSKSL